MKYASNATYVTYIPETQEERERLMKEYQWDGKSEGVCVANPIRPYRPAIHKDDTGSYSI